jgi:general secretion pathway protein N
MARTAHPVRPAVRWLWAVVGCLLAGVVFAPARWLTDRLGPATAGQLQLVNARGTVWAGSADLVLSAGADSRDRTGLPGGLRWRLQPGLAGAWPALRLDLQLPCCADRPLQLEAHPGRQGWQLSARAWEAAWPAALLAGLGTPWNTLQLDGQLRLSSGPWLARREAGAWTLDGQAALQAVRLSSRLAPVRPLGSYRATLEAADGLPPRVAVRTESGALQIDGTGQWRGGRLRFSGEARAEPAHQADLANLLNLMGRRRGDRSLLQMG